MLRYNLPEEDMGVIKINNPYPFVYDTITGLYLFGQKFKKPNLDLIRKFNHDGLEFLFNSNEMVYFMLTLTLSVHLIPELFVQ